MLDKIKNIFKDKNSKEWRDQVTWAKNIVTDTEAVREEYPANVENSLEFHEANAQDNNTFYRDGTVEGSPIELAGIEPDQNTEIEEDYLKYSPLVVGYPDQELQTKIYQGISFYVGTESVLDYGCGRGDFKGFLAANVSNTVDYVGIDLNAPLIEAGKSIYGESLDIRVMNWSEPHDIIKDWAVNITGLNLRYDADMTKNDIQYLEYVIDIMMEHAIRGVIVMLSSSMYEHFDGIIRYNPGDILNKMQEKYGACLIDHSIGNLAFALVIYKS